MPEYNTVDATLWFVAAVGEYSRFTADDDLVRRLWPVLVEEAVRRLGVAVYLVAIALGLATIANVVRFQSIRLHELAAKSARA